MSGKCFYRIVCQNMLFFQNEGLSQNSMIRCDSMPWPLRLQVGPQEFQSPPCPREITWFGSQWRNASLRPLSLGFFVGNWMSQANTWTFWMTQLLEQQLSTQLAGTPYVVQALLLGKVKSHQQTLAFLLCGWSTFPLQCVAGCCFNVHFSKLWQWCRPQNAKNPTKQSKTPKTQPQNCTCGSSALLARCLHQSTWRANGHEVTQIEPPSTCSALAWS